MWPMSTKKKCVSIWYCVDMSDITAMFTELHSLNYSIGIVCWKCVFCVRIRILLNYEYIKNALNIYLRYTLLKASPFHKVDWVHLPVKTKVHSHMDPQCAHNKQEWEFNND